jgi:serine/threonine protein kinase
MYFPSESTDNHHLIHILCSLSYLHSKDIVHRDVKAENMLLDSKGTLKIADFGVARIEAKNPAEMTGVTGTLGYMAPEVLPTANRQFMLSVLYFAFCMTISDSCASSSGP